MSDITGATTSGTPTPRIAPSESVTDFDFAAYAPLPNTEPSGVAAGLMNALGAWQAAEDESAPHTVLVTVMQLGGPEHGLAGVYELTDELVSQLTRAVAISAPAQTGGAR